MDTQKKNEINNCILGVKRRDEASLSRLYELVEPTLRHIALRYMGDEDEALDLEQDFWADIYRICDAFIFFNNGFSYLCKVMTRMALNRLKYLKRRKGNNVRFVDYSRIECYDHSQLTDNLDSKLAVDEALSKLSDLENEIIQLCIFEGKTVRQIASELKLSKSNVGRIQKEALKKIKSEIFLIFWDKTDV